MIQFVSLLLLLAAAAYADTNVQGTISSTTWTIANSPYRVKGALVVPAGETLTIEAGVDVLFDANVPFVVRGSIRAAGTEADRIRFIRGDAGQWGGIRLLGGDSSAFAYTRFSGGAAETGGALYVADVGTRLSLSHCLLSGNQAQRAGGAIAAHYGGTLYLTNCILRDNRSSDLFLGGVLSGPAVLVDCIISGNSPGTVSRVSEATRCVFENNTFGYLLTAGGAFTDCTFRGNSGAGAVVLASAAGSLTSRPDTFLDNRPISETTLTRCRFIDNETVEAPVTVRGDSLAHMTITSCVFSGNRSLGDAPAIRVHGDDRHTRFPDTRRRPVVTIENTVIFQNKGFGRSAVDVSDGDVTVTNCTVSDNGWAPRPGYLGPVPEATDGVSASGVSRAAIVNSILWDNGGPEPVGSYAPVRFSDVMGGSEGEGNLDLDPLFVDPDGGDYALQAGSPALDAGDPNSPHDPDGSRADMGASPVDWIEAATPIDWSEAEKRVAGERSVAFELEQNAPNPFNPRTSIRFRIREASAVRLAVYDVNGRHVRALVDGPMQPGYHTAAWDGTDSQGRAVASGVYLYLLTSAEGTLVRRMLLVR